MHVGVAVVVEGVCESVIMTVVTITSVTAVAVTTATTVVAIVIVVIMRLTGGALAATVDLCFV